jgi:hypothetical protein
MHAIEYPKDCFIVLRSNVKEKLEHFESLSAN